MIKIRKIKEVSEEVGKFLQKQSYNEPPDLNAMYDAEKRMQEFMEAAQITAAEKKQIVLRSTESFADF